MTLTPPPGRFARLRHLLSRMAAFGLARVERLAASAEPAPDHPHTDPRSRAAAFLPVMNRVLRMARALEWLDFLGRVFEGRYHPAPPPPKRAPRTQTPPLSPPPAKRRPRRPRRAPAITRAMRHAFATRPIGQIVTKLCQDLGIAPGTEAWPGELATLTQTPAQWAAAPPKDEPQPPTPKPLKREVRRRLAQQARLLARRANAPPIAPPRKTGRDPP